MHGKTPLGAAVEVDANRGAAAEADTIDIVALEVQVRTSVQRAQCGTAYVGEQGGSS